MNITDAQLIAKYQEVDAQIAALQAQADEAIKPLKANCEIIKNELLRRLNERGADNTKTEEGTAYKSTIRSFKVVDQPALLAFCTAQGGSLEMLDIKVLKDPVKEWVDQTGKLPPGVIENEPFTRINVRRS